VVVTLGIENFLALYGQINIGHLGVIGLTTQSGVLLVRHPFKNTSARLFLIHPLQEISQRYKIPG
jgi:hypothetical protein